MAGPHPVVRIPTELTDRARRSEHHAHVTKYVIYDQEILVIVIERNHVGCLELTITHRVTNHTTDRIGGG